MCLNIIVQNINLISRYILLMHLCVWAWVCSLMSNLMCMYVCNALCSFCDSVALCYIYVTSILIYLLINSLSLSLTLSVFMHPEHTSDKISIRKHKTKYNSAQLCHAEEMLIAGNLHLTTMFLLMFYLFRSFLLFFLWPEQNLVENNNNNNRNWMFIWNSLFVCTVLSKYVFCLL